ncbi:hypothetical protein GUJ93_ZPchr0009g1460 [Zizania palustris]|uniref:Uncharacterized protein n=1 Tax=Zizania palustris TaxID=103762 RepID=A0A8J5RY99_ZIZPA|nr:hypothetical protein GUJ93_ZPchr0009g1460 [Zizania palustris]
MGSRNFLTMAKSLSVAPREQRNTPGDWRAQTPGDWRAQRAEPQPRRRAPAEEAADQRSLAEGAEGSGGGSRGSGELRWRERRKGEAEAAHNREKV